MKLKNIIFSLLTIFTLTSCGAVKGMENELNVVFEYNGEIIDVGTIHQFKNHIAPTLNDAQIPVNHEFFGWTWENPDGVDINKDDFKTKFIEAEGLVRYDLVKNHAENTTVVLRPLFINEADIPVPNYYISIGWYGKTSTSGLNQELVDAWVESLKDYLTTQGATADDLANIKITEYVGDIATAGSQITKDRYNDILIGFGGNIGSTGGVQYIENIGGIPMGNKTRYVTKLTNEKEIVNKVFEWLQTEDGYKALS